MRYVIGVDGGTSRTDALVVDETGRRLGRGHSGPIYAGLGKDHPNARVHLLDVVGEALANSGLQGEQITQVFVSGSHWNTSHTAEVAAWLNTLDVPLAAVTLSDEGGLPAIWAAARFPDPAIVVTLGAFWGAQGVAHDHEFTHPTMWLNVEQNAADLAQGSTIGSLALGAAIKATCGGTATLLYDRICSALAVQGAEALRRWAKENVTVEERARLCMVAAETAHAGDEVAQQLFFQGGVSLARTIIPLAHCMNVAHQPLTIALSGNVWNAGTLLLQPFESTLLEALPQATISVNQRSPEEGAALLALRLAHIHIEDLLS